MSKKIEVLWSGGWDSTFMLLKLAREYDVIQPYYILFNRPGQEHELEAIRKISERIKAQEEIKCNILPVIYVKKEDILEPLWLRRCWEKYKDEPYAVASQYLTLAAFAMQHKGIAVGQERYYETPGQMTRLMYEKGHMRFTRDGVGYFDKSGCQKDVYALFGNAVYPVALFSELMMKEKAEEWGWQDIMGHSWFCYYPVYGKPCGLCGPCRVKIRQRMDFLFSEDNLKAGMVFNYINANNLRDRYGQPLNAAFEEYVRVYKSGRWESGGFLHMDFNSVTNFAIFDEFLGNPKYWRRDP